ncbi:hypothetical protein [Mucilaginibacter lappiensis]|uniref:Uncharacterized protein n=1 Tax=Mucilaginibacter lappiensis TaxID=354630 RepID=A0A841JGV5_9SPHI|nr:hypothetical protein [Mucilaginibacter lappiensis]MBB6128826.1 hypothetical protein [Mucilaginibacter lappiensis]
MYNFIPLIISVLALLLSALTFYYSRLKKGEVKMTKPTTIFFGPDGVNLENSEEKKVFIRTLLYSSSDRGQYIQNMFVRLQRGESIQNFNVWVYDDKGLARGSGLFVNKEGISSNHHFLLPRNAVYDFLPGEYQLEVFVETVNNKTYKIFEQNLNIATSHYEEVMDKKSGIFYDWAPDSKNYDAHVDRRNKKALQC